MVGALDVVAGQGGVELLDIRPFHAEAAARRNKSRRELRERLSESGDRRSDRSRSRPTTYAILEVL